MEGEKQAGGGGIETVGIRGYAYHENGRPAVHALVRLRSREFLADSGIAGLKKEFTVVSGEALTDAAGFYAIDSVASGDYLIEVSAQESAQAALVEAQVPSSGSASGSVWQDVDKAVVKTPGSLVGRLMRQGNPVGGAWAHIYGLQRAIASAADGSFAFADLPEGAYRLVFRQRLPYGYVQTRTLPSVAVSAGRSTDLGMVEFPAGCDAATCDSLVVRHILDVNGLGRVAVDSVSRWNAATGRIEELDLGGLGVKLLPFVQDLATLRTLDLDGNGLDSLPLEVTRMAGLENLSLNYNRLRALPPEIGAMKSLAWLQLFSNSLDSLPQAFGSLNYLRYVTLSYNNLRSLPAGIANLSRLGQLYIHHNRLENLPESLLDLPKLSLIDIHNNRLCDLSARWQAFLDRGSTYDWRAYQLCEP